MEKNAVFGELLYIGLVFEKGRCKRSGIWNRSYIKSLKIHIGLLIEIAKCMQIIRLLGDILSELDKGFRRDKEKICKLIFALHNLPRVYLSMEEPTLCLIGQRGINLDDALNYSKMSMDDEMIVCYKNYFA